MKPVPAAHFDYRGFPPEERLPAFRQLTGALYETWAQGDPQGFRAEAFGYRVGDLVFNECEFSPARFWHKPEHTQGEDRDFLSLQAQLAAQLAAAKANAAAGARLCQEAVDAIAAADALLSDIGFDGIGAYRTGKSGKAIRQVAEALDAYNNNLLCPVP